MFKEFINYRGWKFWTSYDMHMFMLALYYILISQEIYDLKVLALLTFSGFYGLFGFLVNDYFDMKEDIESGKKRSVHSISKRTFKLLIVLAASICILHIIYLNDRVFSIVAIVAMILAFFYSAPPLKFKRRGTLGVIVNCLIEKTLITLAIFVYFSHIALDTFVFLFASFFLHLADILTHQIYDYESDLKTGVKTMVVEIGLERSLLIYRKIVSPLTLISVVMLVYVITISAKYTILIAAIVAGLYLAVYALILKGNIKREERVVPLYISGCFFLIHNTLPPFLSILLMIRHPPYFVLVLLSTLSQYYMIKYKIAKPLKDRIIPHADIFNE